MMPPLKKFKRLDVRALLQNGLDPCSPIFERVDKLTADEGLLIIAPFLPSPLIERLRAQGFASKVERGKGTDWLVYFWREAA